MNPRSSRDKPRLVGVFRHTHFVQSETFIRDQARMLKLPVVFLSRDPSGAASIGEVPVAGRLRSLQGFCGTAGVLRHTLLRDPKPLEGLLRATGVSLLHAHFGVEGMYSAAAADRAGVPHVTTLHGFDVSLPRRALLSSGNPSWVHYAAGRSAFFGRSGSTFICVSRHVQRMAIQLGVPEALTVYLPTGVDVARFDPSAPFNEQPTILHVGRLVPKKGTAQLIRCMKEVLRAVPRARLRIIGAGPESEVLEALVKEMDMSASIEFLGAQSSSVVRKEMSESSVVCVPSVTGPNGDQEGLPTVLLEAGASGRPVVAYDHGGISEGVLDGKTGFLVGEGDMTSLADRLIEVLRNEALGSEFGAAGRRHVEQTYNIVDQAAKLEKIYASL